MGQCKLANKLLKAAETPAPVDPRTYILKDGSLTIQPSAKASYTLGSTGITLAANGYVTFPYAKTGETVFVKYKVLGDGNYNAFSVTKALTASYQGATNTGTVMCAFAQVGNVFVVGAATASVISLCFSQSILITEIWTETA